MNYTEAIRTLSVAVGYQRGINKDSFNISKIEEKTLEIAAGYNHDQLIKLCEDKFNLIDAVHKSFDEPAVKRTTINRKYTHFCVSKATGLIVDGWEYPYLYEPSEIMEFYKSDMRDNDRKLKDYKLERAVELYKRGIDPYDSVNWGNS